MLATSWTYFNHLPWFNVPVCSNCKLVSMDDISRCLGGGESASNVDLPTCEAAVEFLTTVDYALASTQSRTSSWPYLVVDLFVKSFVDPPADQGLLPRLRLTAVEVELSL